MEKLTPGFITIYGNAIASNTTKQNQFFKLSINIINFDIFDSINLIKSFLIKYLLLISYNKKEIYSDN